MMKYLIPAILTIALLPLTTFGQFYISGDLSPSAMLKISDFSIIDLPFRVGNLSVDYAKGDFEFKTVSTMETRWERPDTAGLKIDLREAYLVWYPSFGEVKLGKMIHAWGAADANNPTDNLSPYDYYYMFLSGTDRKIGSPSLAAKAYMNDFQFEFVALPEFVANRFPLNEPDFPIDIPVPEDAHYFYPENEFEFGGRVQYSMGIGDVSASYFNGHDRSFSPAGMEIDLTTLPTLGAPTFTSHLTYRNTDVFGLDAVLFPGNWTVRGEFAFFRTETPAIDYTMSKFFYDAQYLQSVIQLEYSFANSVELMGQFISNKTQSLDASMEKNGNFQTVELMLQDTSDHSLDPLRAQFSQMGIPEFSAGMGTPFALISDQVAILSSMVTLLDNALELRAMLMVNLEETGYMTNIGSSYSLIPGLNLETSLAYFIGGDEAGNRFKQLEDFSNLTIGISYSF